MLRGLTAAAACLGLAASAIAAAPVTLDNDLPYYETGSSVSGSITSMGSETMQNLMNQWFERYERYYPKVAIEIESKGSYSAIPGLIMGVAQLGPMSRDMLKNEIKGFESRFGYKPVQLRTAIDAVAIFVHEDNPIEGLTMAQVEQVFSVKGADMTWGDLGLTGDWADQPVTLYGRNSNSADFGFFKEVGLGGADFKTTVTERPGSETVVQDIANDKYAMGYSGMGYATTGVRVLPLAINDMSSMFVPSAETASNGNYPLTRNLYLTVNYRSGAEMPSNRAEFFKLIYSKQGQEIVIKNGFYPVSANVARKELLRIGIAIES